MSAAFAVVSTPVALRRTHQARSLATAKPAAVRAACRVRSSRQVICEAGEIQSQVQTQEETAITGMVFEPLGTLEEVPKTQAESLARQHYNPACEAALNDQINIEYNVSYIYHAMYAYFDRDNVALPGLAKYFKEASEEERGHAELMMDYQNMRGGKVKMQSIIMPDMEFGSTEQGDAQYAMELALSLEKLNNEKLLALHKVAEECDDPQMTDYIEGTFLEDQVESIKKVSEFVSQLRRVGIGHGTYEWDQDLLQMAA